MDESIQRQLQQSNETAEVLRRARSLIDSPEKWCCEDAMVGNRKCVVMAIQMTVDYEGSAAGAFLRQASHELFGTFPSVANRRGHAAAMRMFDRAIALAEGR